MADVIATFPVAPVSDLNRSIGVPIGAPPLTLDWRDGDLFAALSGAVLDQLATRPPPEAFANFTADPDDYE